MRALRGLAEDIHAYRFVPDGTFGYRQAEVTRAGWTQGPSPETMESARPGSLFHR